MTERIAITAGCATAKAMIDHYIRLGAAVVAGERQRREVAARISNGYTRKRGGVDSAGRLPGVAASRRKRR